MGRVTAKIKVENIFDYFLSKRGDILSNQIRSLEIEDALVDTGSTLLCLRYEQIIDLGLLPLEIRKAKTANGPVERQVYEGARLTIMGRTCSIDVMEIPEDVPVLIGYLVLEGLDLQPDPKAQKVIPNPAHDGKFIMDLY
ncbi:MAG: aspartyl protease [bacterium]|nr:aspartyl protease [bacterium]